MTADFKNWLKRVDRIVSGIAGIGITDLGDIDYGALFEDEISPADAAREVLLANDYPPDLLP